MAVRVVHAKVSAVPDVGNASLVQPSDWNADHAVTGAVALSGDTMTGTLSLPAGAVGAPSLNFGTALNGLYGTASTLFFGIGGAQRFAVWGSIIDHNAVCRFTGGTAAATSLHFGTNGTGIYGSAATVSFATNAVNRLTVADAGVTTTVPVVTPAATTAATSIRIPHGVAPTTPTDGDLWTTTVGVFARINGATQQVSPGWVQLTQAAYDALTPKDPNLLYVVVG